MICYKLKQQSWYWKNTKIWNIAIFIKYYIYD